MAGINFTGIPPQELVRNPYVSTEVVYLSFVGIPSQELVKEPAISKLGTVFVLFSGVSPQEQVRNPSLSTPPLEGVTFSGIPSQERVLNPKIATYAAPAPPEEAQEEVLWFSNDRSNKLLIGFSRGILVYPNRDKDFSSNTTYATYEDEVDYYGRSSGRGIETRLVINLGSLYSIISDSTIYEVILDFGYGFQSKSGNGNLKVKLFSGYYNRETDSPVHETVVPFQTKRGSIRVFFEEGIVVQSGTLEIVIPNDVLSDIGELKISRISVGYVERRRLGTE